MLAFSNGLKSFLISLEHLTSLTNRQQIMGFLQEYGENEAPLLQEEKPKKQSFPFKLLFRYLFTSFMVLAHLCSFSAYLGFKSVLYIREYRSVLASPWVLVILSCEWGYFASSLTYCIEYLLPPWINKKGTFPLPNDERDFPTVDILMPCCKEPTDVVVDTILAALAQDYPADRFRLLVLDDGADEDLKAFCEMMKAETGGKQIDYLRRIKTPEVPHNFKCGNLNNGLQNSNAEYVAMLDADMILHPSFLRTLLPHIIDSPNISFVQVPQVYYNLPIGDPLNDASASFYGATLVQRNLLGCASCVGTGAIFRREHLDLIGGYQPQSITEDCMTAYALFNEGYKSVYLNRHLQMGLSPWSFGRYLKQRERWCLGAIQQFSSSWKSMLGLRSKLSFFNKLFFISYTGYFYLSILNVIMQVVFLCALAFHLNLAIGDHTETRRLVVYLALYVVVWRLTWIVLWWKIPQRVLGRNREESHFWWMSPYFSMTIVRAIFPKIFTIKYVVTSSVDNDVSTSKANRFAWIKKMEHLKPLTFHLGYLCLTISLVLWQSYKVHKRGSFRNKEVVLVAGVSMFLLTTCFHMLVPLIYIVWPTSFSPSLRKSILQYDSNGVPQFSEASCVPKWHWHVVFYEALSYSIIVIWSGVLFVAIFETDSHWWRQA